MMFGSRQGLEFLAKSKILLMDGNFKMAPPQFNQVYVFRVPFKGSAVSCAYALLQNKARRTYTECFNALVNELEDLGLEMVVEKVITDFEIAVVKAVQSAFGPGLHQGCFFHFTQSTWRKISKLGHAELYKEDAEFRQYCCMLDALALLPLDKVKDGLAYLREIMPCDEAEELTKYFDETYVNGVYKVRNVGTTPDGLPINRIVHTPPLFPPELWNVHLPTLSDDPRTNNLCEGWNNWLKNFVRQLHPHLYNLIDALKTDNYLFKNVLLRDSVGSPPRLKRNRKREIAQRRLRNLCLEIQQRHRSMEDFLHAAGFNIRMYLPREEDEVDEEEEDDD